MDISVVVTEDRGSLRGHRRPGQPADRLYLVAHGRVERHGAGHFDEGTDLGVVADGGYFGTDTLVAGGDWEYTPVAATGR